MRVCVCVCISIYIRVEIPSMGSRMVEGCLRESASVGRMDMILALPVRSPYPFTVPWISKAPPRTAASEVADIERTRVSPAAFKDI